VPSRKSESNRIESNRILRYRSFCKQLPGGIPIPLHNLQFILPCQPTTLQNKHRQNEGTDQPIDRSIRSSTRSNGKRGFARVPNPTGTCLHPPRLLNYVYDESIRFDSIRFVHPFIRYIVVHWTDRPTDLLAVSFVHLR